MRLSEMYEHASDLWIGRNPMPRSRTHCSRVDEADRNVVFVYYLDGGFLLRDLADYTFSRREYKTLNGMKEL
jgi:hypothetical protein